MNSEFFSRYEIPGDSEFLKPELFNAIYKAGELAQEVRSKALTYAYKTGKDDIVTSADTAVSEFLGGFINGFYPGIGIIDEETNWDTSKTIENCVYLDPIDGTTNFFNDNPNWAISLGFQKNGKLQAGIVYLPKRERFIYGEIGRGVYINGNSLKPSEYGDPIKIVFSHPYAHDASERNASESLLAKLILDGVECQTFGSQVVELSEVIEGRADAFFHFKTKPWDVAASIVIIKELGGSVLSINGSEYECFSDQIAIVGPGRDQQRIIQIIHDAALDL